MSEKEISIKVNICDRFYPLRISTSEEESVRKAAKKITERAKYYIDNFSVQDKQDALAMAALEFASESKEAPSKHTDADNINTKLKELEQLLDI
ncbi:cell division protein ZapA [Bacteroidia bacterium]|jgi:cell division protein ZapA (FtsZ GTPase activity inhibitor)|nr:cell division protein ZapA [Bacteroidota bacterium]MDB4174095.1 cell division protein ZapA [Bacteroidia bacterium]